MHANKVVAIPTSLDDRFTPGPPRLENECDENEVNPPPPSIPSSPSPPNGENIGPPNSVEKGDKKPLEMEL
ncbi:hypothetical protein E2C01_023784 [Portunus trituberculatus]|uniref:Uncharacterized protein n=1 Tax=Portunus trituberculatus TaxID=210409 RepID=A0A5B7EAW9_PORTR|nr:hypothetical protein [Portunus trituberculatus]